jgi:hypothetical protein
MVDTVKTRAQLIERAAAAIGVKEPGEALSSEDYDAFDNLVDPLIAQLSADGIYYVNDADEIPVEIFIPLANLLGNMAGPDFGSPVNDQAQARDEGILRRLASTKPTYVTAKIMPY